VLPFTPEVFFNLFAEYNRAIWPAQHIAYALGVAAVVLAARPFRGGGRITAAILATFWLWTGIVYHWLYFAPINFIAPAFAALFVLQGLLLAWTGVLRGRLEFRFRPDAQGWTGLGVIIFAMALYPLLAWSFGHRWPQTAMFGVAPCPTTIFTLGLLLLAQPRPPWHLLPIPLFWCLIGASAAWLLETPEDLSLLLAALFALAVILSRRSTVQ